MPVHERVWERVDSVAKPWRPIATYTMLGVMAVVYLAEMAVANARPALFDTLFVINVTWPWQPWTLVTSTFAHLGTSHLLLNALFLFFIGPSLERIVGVKRYVILVLAAGAFAGLVQVHLSDYLGDSKGALGISGALNAIFGTLVVLTPKQKLLIYGIVPVPFWAAAAGYAILDVMRAFDPTSPIAAFAHLSGLAVGLAYGTYVRGDLKRRGLRLVDG